MGLQTHHRVSCQATLQHGQKRLRWVIKHRISGWPSQNRRWCSWTVLRCKVNVQKRWRNPRQQVYHDRRLCRSRIQLSWDHYAPVLPQSQIPRSHLSAQRKPWMQKCYHDVWIFGLNQQKVRQLQLLEIFLLNIWLPAFGVNCQWYCVVCSRWAFSRLTHHWSNETYW